MKLIVALLLISSYGCHQTVIENDNQNLSNLSKTELEKGANLFNLQCARCHGIEGSGSNGPSLRRQSFTHAQDDVTLMSVIQNGIPGTEMPGTWLLSPTDVRMVAGYIRSLSQVEDGTVKGDVSNGKLIYDTQGACQTCHSINNIGGSLGPDLTRVGAKRSADYIRQNLINPGFFKKDNEVSNTANGFIPNLLVEVITKDGKEVTGMRVNEDTFSLQLRDVQNRVHSYKKSDLIAMNKLFEKSFMPSVKDVLTDSETDDLVAYMVSLN